MLYDYLIYLFTEHNYRYAYLYANSYIAVVYKCESYIIYLQIANNRHITAALTPTKLMDQMAGLRCLKVKIILYRIHTYTLLILYAP